MNHEPSSMNKLEEITKLRAQGMSLAEAREKVVGPLPPKLKMALVLEEYLPIANRIRELRATGLPLADAKAQAEREFGKRP